MVGSGVCCPTLATGAVSGSDSTPPRPASRSTRAATTARSRPVIGTCGPLVLCPASFRALFNEQEHHQREQHEQREQQDRELPQAALDPPPAAVDAGVATERAGQAGAAGLEQDGGDEGDAEQDSRMARRGCTSWLTSEM